MNERIRELMVRAISDVDSIDDIETRRMYIPNCFAEKFTELIVKECLTACQRVHDSCEDTTKQFDIDTMQRQIGVNLCKVEIKKLFDLDIR